MSETSKITLKDLAEREVAMHPNRRIEDFTIFYGQRSGMGMPPNSTFHLHVISWDSKARVLRTWPVVLPSRSGVLKTHGTGKAGVDKWSDAWTLSDQGNTSRTMFSAFCDSLQAKADPMSGGEPQLVGLYRQGPGQVFGVVTERGPSLHGSLLLDVPPGVKIEWRDQLFQRVSASGELLGNIIQTPFFYQPDGLGGQWATWDTKTLGKENNKDDYTVAKALFDALHAAPGAPA